MEKKRITERTLDALRRLQQNGILLAVATRGVPPLIVPKFDGVEFDVFLTYNGSYCYDRRGDIFASPHPAAGCADADPKTPQRLVVRCRLQDGRSCSPTARMTI